MVSQQLVNTLKGLGVNALEAEVYCTLLKHNGVTAYRLAKILNKATANVYKSVKVLATIGGVVIQQSSKELCYSVQPEIFLASLEASFQEKKLRASELLNKNIHNLDVQGIYHLENAQLAILQAKNAINNAKKAIIIDAFPQALKTLKPTLQAAIKRGVRVSVQAYDDINLAGTDLVKAFETEKVIGFWKTEQLNMVVDGKECFVCLFNNDLSEINQGMWSKDLYLACVLHVGLTREHFFHKLKKIAKNKQLLPELDDLIEQQTGLILDDILGRNELKTLMQYSYISPDKQKFNIKPERKVSTSSS